jgi:uncharacterized protein with HEPN domain
VGRTGSDRHLAELRMSFAPREYLRHIADEAASLESATVGVSRDAFLGDPTLQRACVRSFEIIGEATTRSGRSCGPRIRRWLGTRWRACVIG